MNSAFLCFRLRQFKKVICEIPVIYLIILTGILLVAGIALYGFTNEMKGSLIVTAILLASFYLIQVRRRDYHFVLLAEEKAWKVFGMDYLLLGFPVAIIILIHSYWFISLGIIAGCIGIGFIKQPLHRTGRGMTPPKQIPAEAFEIRSGIRQHGGILLVLYLSAWIGLWVPFASLASLWFFTVFFSDMFRYSESEQILFSQERSAKSFLCRKLEVNLKLFLYATGPVCLVYLLLYPDQWWLIITFVVAIALNVALFIVTKYAYYRPNAKITAGQVPIALAMLSIFLPVLLPVILFFLIKNCLAACRNLKTYLYAYNPEFASGV